MNVQAFERDLERAIRREAYRAPMTLDGGTLRARLAADAVAHRRRTLGATLAAVAATALVVVAGVAWLQTIRPAVLTPAGATHSPGTPVTASASPLPALGPRYPDGIPSSIDGEKVVRPPDVEGGRPQPAATAYLLGGWSPDAFARSCPAFHADDPAYVLTPTCGGWPIGDTPLVWDTPAAPSVNVSVITDGRIVPGGPVVLRVHVDDPRAARCPVGRRALCEAAIVVDAVVWVGQDDPLTATAPLRADQVAERLLEAFPDIRFLPREEGCASGAPCPKSVYSVYDCDPGWPAQTWETSEDQLGRIVVFASAAARQQTQANLTPSGWQGTRAGGSPCAVGFDATFTSDWLAVDNVLVDVHVAPGGPTATQRSLLDRIREALVAEGTAAAAPSACDPAAASASTPADKAKAVVSAFEQKHQGGGWAAAWSCLASLSQSSAGSLESWMSAGQSFNAAGGGPFTVEEPTLDWTILDYAYVGDLETDVRAKADVEETYAVWVRHPGFNAVSGGSEGLLVGPLLDGTGWRIWIVH